MSAIDGHNYPIVAIDDRDPVTTTIIIDGAIPRGHSPKVTFIAFTDYDVLMRPRSLSGARRRIGRN